MMMDHHRFIQPNKNSNVMIGGSSNRSSGSGSTDELTASDPAAPDNEFSSGVNLSGIHSPPGPTANSPPIFGDDAFDKIDMDFDLSNDLDVSNPASSSLGLKPSAFPSSCDNSVNSETLLEKMVLSDLDGEPELKGMVGVTNSPEENTKMGMSSKLGDIGDELDMDLFDDLLPDGEGGKNNNQQPQEGSDSTMDKLFKDGNISDSDTNMEKLLNMPLIDVDGQKPSATSGSNTANINLSLKNVGSNGSLADSVGSLPSIGAISPNASFQQLGNKNAAANNAAMAQQASVQQQIAARQQLILMQRQQQLLLQQQQQQQQQQGNNNPKNSASIQSIVNDQLSQLPQGNQMGVAGLQQEKMKLIQRLQEIERSGIAMNAGQQQMQQQQQQQQQFLMQQQMLLNQQQQQQLQQQQQQQAIATASSRPTLRPGLQRSQGQLQVQGDQQMMQQQQGRGLLTQASMNAVPAPTPFSVNSNSMSTNTTTEQLRQQQVQSSNSKPKKKNAFSSIMGSKGKDTPLLSFLRNKKGSGNTNMSLTSQQQQQLASPTAANMADAANNNSISSINSDILDVTPIDFGSSSNPFLRKQMMNNLDRSVNRHSAMRGRGIAGRGLSTAVRANMMKQMASDDRVSKSCKEFQRANFESAGILSRQASLDHIPLRRTSLSAGAAKAQNRRFQLTRSNNSSSGSFSNLAKTKGGSKRDLRKVETGNSARSLPGKFGGGGSARSLGSNDSTGSFVPVRARGSGASGRGGHGAKHKLGGRRTSSVPFMNASFSEDSDDIRKLMEENERVTRMLEENERRTQQNDGWP